METRSLRKQENGWKIILAGRCGHLITSLNMASEQATRRTEAFLLPQKEFDYFQRIQIPNHRSLVPTSLENVKKQDHNTAQPTGPQRFQDRASCSSVHCRSQLTLPAGQERTCTSHTTSSAFFRRSLLLLDWMGDAALQSRIEGRSTKGLLFTSSSLKALQGKEAAHVCDQRVCRSGTCAETRPMVDLEDELLVVISVVRDAGQHSSGQKKLSVCLTDSKGLYDRNATHCEHSQRARSVVLATSAWL